MATDAGSGSEGLHTSYVSRSISGPEQMFDLSHSFLIERSVLGHQIIQNVTHHSHPVLRCDLPADRVRSNQTACKTLLHVFTQVCVYKTGRSVNFVTVNLHPYSDNVCVKE